MSERIPPHDIPTERALLGAMLLQPSIISDARWLVEVADFYKPIHQAIWDAMKTLHSSGQAVDQITVANALKGLVADPHELLHGLLNELPSVSRWPAYCDTIVRAATGRRLLALTAGAVDRVYEGSDPWEVAGNLEVDLDGLGRLSAAIPDGFMSADTFAELGDEVMPPWVVPGWLRQGDRTIVVAEEGVGKSVFTLQVAMLAAQGVNPLWTPHRFDPCTTLVLDLENPAYVLRDRVRDLRSRLQLNHTYVDGLCHIWHRPSGIDLRSRSTRRELDAVLTDVQPSLVILSPLYKAFRKGAREDHEDVAAELQAIIDDLRARFRFALIIEHHAAKGTAAARDMVPFGSSLWLRWPEYGIALTKVDKGDSSKVEFGRFRGDRVRNPGWPTTMEWGDNWPWLARYEHGTPWVSQTEMDF